MAFERGTSAKRHPWFIEGRRAVIAAMRQRYGIQLEENTTVTRNYGILGGWLKCEFWTVLGEPTGITSSTWSP